MKLQHSARSIAIAGHTGDAQAVIEALISDDPALRIAALGAATRLEILGEESLLAALADPSPAVRRRAAELTPKACTNPGADGEQRRGRGGGGSVRVVEQLVDLLDDPSCAEVAAHALGEVDALPVESTAAVEDALADQATSHDDPICRESAVAALGSLGLGLEAVLAATGDVATVRRRAVIALANFDGPDVDEAVTRATNDRDWQVRQAAEDLLA